MIRFDGQVAIATGSGRGLGAAYARLLAARGAAVVVHDAGVGADGSGSDPAVADAVVGEIVAAGGTAVAAYENLESETGCRELVASAIDRFGRVDILIHNAGLLAYTPVEESDARAWERLRKVGIDAPLLLSAAAFPHMKRQGYGRVVVTTSGRAMSLDAAQPGLAAYAMGKMAQLGLMNVLAVEGAPFGIRANAISPVAATRLLQRAVAPGEMAPEQVAPAVAFLVSRQCDFSGMVVRAAAGRFSIARWTFNEGIDLGAAPTPEAIAEQWHAIKRV